MEALAGTKSQGFNLLIVNLCSIYTYGVKSTRSVGKNYSLDLSVIFEKCTSAYIFNSKSVRFVLLRPNFAKSL